MSCLGGSVFFDWKCIWVVSFFSARLGSIASGNRARSIMGIEMWGTTQGFVAKHLVGLQVLVGDESLAERLLQSY
jgi:hypothetical protein